MSIVTINDKHLTDIATAIRQKSGVEDTFKPSEMAKAIKDINGGNPILQDIVVNPSISEQTITPSVDYDGINQVKVNAVTSSIDSDIKPENIKKGINILGVDGTIEDKPAEPILQNKTVNPSTGEQIITADSGYDGLGNVTINAVTSSIDSNIKADNIKQGITILGVEGTLEQGAEVVRKYKPRWILFRDAPYGVTDLSEETRMVDTSLITSMYQTFSSSRYLTAVDVSEWDTSNVTNMSYMFYNCTQLSSAGSFKNFNTSNVTDMSYMFRATVIPTLDLSSFDTTNVTNMSYMINNCTQTTSINVSSFNTENVTTMENMFGNCISLTELNLSNFITSKVTKFSQMFSGCTALQKLDIRNFTFEKMNSNGSMFYNVPVDCLIIVKSDTEKTKILSIRSDFTNVKTLAEYQAEGGV